ncbi:MAG: ABC transporter substrate-binding protein [Candidatus Methanoplasma sp.]|nr:ABC transporter substrate-binding protein [Candidatus Methanoplasma sp.]
MKSAIIVAAIAAAAIIVAAGAAVALSSPGGGEERSGPVTVTDYLDREVTIGSSDRIVSQQANITAMLCGLGVGSRIVAASSDAGIYDEDPGVIGMADDDFPKAVKDGIAAGRIKELGGMYNMSAETLVSVESDLIIIGSYGITPETRKKLDDLGATYIVTSMSHNTIEDLYADMAIIGKAVGREAQAEKMESEMRSAIGKISGWCESIVDKEMGGTRPRVALMMTSTYATGDGYIGGDVLKALCADNVFGYVGRYAPVSKESIAAEDPEALMYQNVGMGDNVSSPAEYVMSLYGDPVIGRTSAAGSGSIFATVDAAKNATSYTNQGFVRAYAIWAMFIYHDSLPFDVPPVLDSGNCSEYLSKFWAVVSG